MRDVFFDLTKYGPLESRDKCIHETTLANECKECLSINGMCKHGVPFGGPVGCAECYEERRNTNFEPFDLELDEE